MLDGFSTRRSSHHSASFRNHRTMYEVIEHTFQGYNCCEFCRKHTWRPFSCKARYSWTLSNRTKITLSPIRALSLSHVQRPCTWCVCVFLCLRGCVTCVCVRWAKCVTYVGCRQLCGGGGQTWCRCVAHMFTGTYKQVDIHLDWSRGFLDINYCRISHRYFGRFNLCAVEMNLFDMCKLLLKLNLSGGGLERKYSRSIL